jgi:hypothetical protein
MLRSRSLSWVPVVVIVAIIVGACASPPADSSARADVPDRTGGDQTGTDEIRATSLDGAYAPSIEEEGWEDGEVRVTDSARSVEVLGETYALSRVRGDVLVFSEGRDGSCDNPGCSYVSRVGGVVYMKDVDGRSVPAVKVILTRTYEHPEYEGDLEGEHDDEYHFERRGD